MDDNLKMELCVCGFEGTCRAYVARGMILPSDRDSQFTSANFRKSLA